MQTSFPYSPDQSILVSHAAARLRALFPDISIVQTDWALEFANIPAGQDADVMHAAASQLIAARGSVQRPAA